MKAKVLVVPVYRGSWLYCTWTECQAQAATERALHWTQGASLQDKATLLGKELSTKINAVAQRQWRSMQASDEGTFKNRVYKLAQWVLSKEDPTETFLKSLPREACALEVIHPATVKERLVRRRLRRMALAREHYHNRRILGWTLATLPQLPLALTPLPNVTLYYTVYKMVSHYQALQGCRMLRAAFERYDQAERAAAARQAAGRGGILRLLPWTRGGGSNGGRAHGSGNGGGGSTGTATRGAADGPHSGTQAASTSYGSGGGSSGGDGQGPLLVPEFHGDRALDRAVRPLERWQTPLPDEIALRVRDMFTARTKGGADGRAELGGGAEALPELVARLRRRALEQGQTGRSNSGCR
ncbi:hypothetical protein TSOC_008254 [Tetrabaena socialis]|uniref:Uncharacterized protein n=1 Tax=Tetrabaena socialis TaxID=47790 RepID=A0A2J7ZYY7_9CHLO|nr:hypothetical protein TSOC_008254 [Tetrabaena socialis]|eukprot:PNH05484.1 hypothetical protein TSOC_008254 [Tetrabaena socialis]